MEPGLSSPATPTPIYNPQPRSLPISAAPHHQQQHQQQAFHQPLTISSDPQQAYQFYIQNNQTRVRPPPSTHWKGHSSSSSASTSTYTPVHPNINQGSTQTQLAEPSRSHPTYSNAPNTMVVYPSRSNYNPDPPNPNTIYNNNIYPNNTRPDSSDSTTSVPSLSHGPSPVTEDLGEVPSGFIFSQTHDRGRGEPSSVERGIGISPLFPEGQMSSPKEVEEEGWDIGDRLEER